MQWGQADDESDDESDDDGGLGQYYPPKPVWRTENWGWKCRNAFATSVTHAKTPSTHCILNIQHPQQPWPSNCLNECEHCCMVG
jgi:hypothetical protein